MILTLLLLSVVNAAAPQELARAIEIWSEHPIAVEIAWLTIDDEGRETVTAKRRTAIGPPVPLEFVHAAGRYVRFSYEGASPRTYSTGELLTARRLHVPDVLPGGELLLHVPHMTVRPVQLLVNGPRVHAVAFDSALHASLAGVPPGEYRVTPVYEGGLKSDVRTISVRAAETTLAHFPPENVGAARITAAPEVCDSATEVTMDAFVMPKPDPQFTVSPGRSRILTTREPRCDMTVGGLPPGQLEVFYRREGSDAGSSRFEASAQTLTAVTIAGPPVTVEGRVTLNGKPLAATIVSFAARPVQGQTASPRIQANAKTDTQGYYRLALDAPGAYNAMILRARTAPGQTKQVTLVEGRNFQDIALTGGTIRVELTGWPEGAVVQVRLQGTSEGSRSVMVTTLNVKEPQPFEGLSFGEYKLSLVMPGRGAMDRASIMTVPPDAKTVILSPASPEATVTFDIRQ
ncbi:MAG TPA: hypothetical protein VMN81_13705 [Vicinamibacterales bacterium]|nr:hypothetical protein [Vicinamibacterales bacterium]